MLSFNLSLLRDLQHFRSTEQLVLNKLSTNRLSSGKMQQSNKIQRRSSLATIFNYRLYDALIESSCIKPKLHGFNLLWICRAACCRHTLNPQHTEVSGAWA